MRDRHICEGCLRAVDPGARWCPRHPAAELLDPSCPQDREYLEMIRQRRQARRDERLALISGMLLFPVLLLPLLELWRRLSGRKHAVPALPAPTSTLLPAAPPSTTEEGAEAAAALRQRRGEERGSGHRPRPGRVNVAG